MRTLRVLLAAAALLAVTGGVARAAAPPAKPPLVELRWHLVARGVTDVEASDRYLAYETSPGLTLVDRQSHAVTELPATACPAPERLGPLLGGPWVGACSTAESHPLQLQLYNIVEHQWVAVPDRACFPCFPVAVGSQWIEIANVGCQAHCGRDVILENIATGEIEADPVLPQGDFREDLDSPTGTSPLCPPLRYPAGFDGGDQQIEPGSLTMLGQFALTRLGGAYLLERCHASWQQRLKGEALGSSKMVLWSRDYWVYQGSPDHGLLLPSLRRFNFTIPRRFQPRLTGLAAIGLSGRTIYVLTERHALWSARVPRIG